MKKIFAAILALTLLAACALAESADITGMWYYDMYGLVATLELREDSTFTMGFVGENQSGVYTFDGANLTLTYDGEEASHVGTYDPAAQTISVEDGRYVFGRDEIVAYVPGNVREDVAIEDFTGSWACYRVGTQGMYIDPVGAGISMDAVIDGDSLVLSLAFGGEAMELPVTGSYADGTLTAGVIADDGAGNTTSVTFEMRLLEDGNLAAAFMEGGDITFYLTPVVEEVPAE